jgi:hypothetical protein
MVRYAKTIVTVLRGDILCNQPILPCFLPFGLVSWRRSSRETLSESFRMSLVGRDILGKLDACGILGQKTNQSEWASKRNSR